MTTKIKNYLLGALLCSSIAVFTSSCSDDDSVPTYPVTIVDNMPADLPANATVKSGSLLYTELNTGIKTVYEYPLTAEDVVPEGTYNIEGTIVVSIPTEARANTIEKTMRAVANQVVISKNSPSVSLNWYFYNPDNTLVFGEIFITGTLNAKGTNGLYDTYFTIYNNTDEVQYADGLAIVESKLLNSYTDQILTEANLPENNFTVGAVYVIPGNGTDVAIQPGKSIKIVDQAIDWNAEVSGALNHTDADFEWYDVVTGKGTQDTDNPDVPNLDKWFSYSATIWIPSNQCNRSYALVRFPQGMTAETFLAQQNGEYKYVNAATGKEMAGTKCYLIKYDWIIDGVNLCPTEKYTSGVLRSDVDMSYAAISDKNSDKNRFGKKFARKKSGTSPAGNAILMDTNDSASDFEIVSVK